MKKIFLILVLFIPSLSIAQLDPSNFPDGVTTPFIEPLNTYTLSQLNAMTNIPIGRKLFNSEDNGATGVWMFWDGNSWEVIGSGGGGSFSVASASEVNTGTDNAKGITPLALADSQLQADVTANNAKTSFTGFTTISTDYPSFNVATEYNNAVPFATQAEMQNGTETLQRRVSPLRIKEAIDSNISDLNLSNYVDITSQQNITGSKFFQGGVVVNGASNFGGSVTVQNNMSFDGVSNINGLAPHPYDASWASSGTVPIKPDIYNKIESLSGTDISLSTAINSETTVQGSLEDHETRIDNLLTDVTTNNAKTSFTGFTTLTNDYGIGTGSGVTWTGNEFKLTGQITSNALLTLAGGNFTVLNVGENGGVISVNDNITSHASGNGNAEFGIANGTGALKEGFRAYSDKFEFKSNNGRGIEYDADYSSGFTNRTLVDKGYVDDAISSAAGGGGGVNTNLSISSTKTSTTVNSSTGSNAVIPLANGTLAGVTENNFSDTEKTLLGTALQSSDLSNYVDVTSQQNISGNKFFQGAVVVNGPSNFGGSVTVQNNMSFDGVSNINGLAADPYDASWALNATVPIKPDIYNKIESLSGTDISLSTVVNSETTVQGSLEDHEIRIDNLETSVIGGGSFVAASASEINTGTNNTKGITPLALAGSQLQADVTANNAKTSFTGFTTINADYPSFNVATEYNNVVPFATQAEMQNGTETLQRRVSPLRIKEAIDSNISDLNLSNYVDKTSNESIFGEKEFQDYTEFNNDVYIADIIDFGNTISVSRNMFFDGNTNISGLAPHPYDSSWASSGTVPIKPDIYNKIESLSGTDISLSTSVNSETTVQGSLDDHETRIDNLETAGGGGSFTVASTSEINTGTDNAKGITPLGLANSQLQADVDANTAKTAINPASTELTSSATVTYAYNPTQPNRDIDITQNTTVSVTSTTVGDSGYLELYPTGSQTITLVNEDGGELDVIGNSKLVVAYYRHTRRNGLVWFVSDDVFATPNIVDNTAPSNPTGLGASNPSSSTVDLSWTASTDNIGVTGYRTYIDGVLGTDVGNVTSTTVTGLALSTSYDFNVRAYDASNNESGNSNTVTETTTTTADDAQLFIDAVSTLNITEENAIRSLVTDFKNDGVWNKLLTIYPIIGGTESAHKYNLKNALDTDAANRLTFSGTISHTSTGMKGAGGTANTHFNISTDITDPNSFSVGYYSVTADEDPNGFEMGGISGNRMLLKMGYGSGTQAGFDAYLNDAANSVSANHNGEAGLFVGTKISDTDSRLYKDGLEIGSNTSTATATPPNIDITILGAGGTTSTRECAFAFIGNGLTAIDVQNIYTAIQTFQIALGRQVATDFEAPTAPTSFLVSNATNTTVDLSWTAATDNVGVTGYKLYDNEVFVTDIANVTSYTATGLELGREYNFTLRANDLDGNISTDSSVSTISTTGTNVLDTANVRLIVANSSSLNANDTYVSNLLTSLGVGTVQVVSEGSLGSITNHDITVIAESINSSTVASLKTEAKPIITFETGNFDEFSFSGASLSSTSITSLTIDNSHPITTDITSPFTYNSGGGAQSQGHMDFSANATATAYIASGVANQYSVIAFDTGDTLDDASTATDKRIYLSGGNTALWGGITERILENSLKWSFGLTP